MQNKEREAARKKAYQEAHKEEYAAKSKAYREANKEKLAAKSRAYREANKETLAARKKAYQEAHKETLAAKSKAYREANKEKLAARKKAYYEAHKEEIKARRNSEEKRQARRAYRVANKEHRRDKGLQRKYGISLADYNRMFAEQGGCCKICGKQESRGRNKKLVVDHNHANGKVRGLLCHHCNVVLGKAFEKQAVLTKAREYLKEDRLAGRRRSDRRKSETPVEHERRSGKERRLSIAS